LEHEKILEAVTQAIEKSPQRKFSESVDLAINLKNLDMNQPTNRLDEEIILPNALEVPIRSRYSQKVIPHRGQSCRCRLCF